MDDSGTANSGTDEYYPEGGTARQDVDGGRPARQGLARFARPALVAGGIIAGVLYWGVFLKDREPATP